MKNAGVQNGLYLGVALSLLMMVMYFFSPEFMLSWGSWFSFLVYILFMVKAGKEEKEMMGGYASFGEMLKPTFLTYLIGSFLGTAFTYILVNLIDPSLIDVMKDIQIEAIEKMGAFLEEDALEIAKDSILENENPYSLGNVLLGWGVGLIFPGIIFALVISAIIKNEKVDDWNT